MAKKEEEKVIHSDETISEDDEANDDKGATTMAGLLETLFPPKDEKGEENGIGYRIWFFLCPRFSMKTFTFWFSIFWAGWNAFIFVMYIGEKKKLTYPMDCTMINYFCGSITPYIRYDYQYYRPFIAIVTADGIGTTALGFIVLWMHGFEYEHFFKTGQVVTVMFVSA